MATTRLFKSTDTGAVALSGQVSKLVDVLDSVLVNGYNSQTITSITRSGSTATATKTAHGFNSGQRIVHSGAVQTEYNIDTAITVTDANTYTYTVTGTPATPATGTISAKVAGAGWTKPFTAVNKAVFRNSATAGTGFYLNVQDHGAVTAQEARIWGYEVATAQDTGTGPFPTTVQMLTGLFVRKSVSADATARSWYILADETVLYMFIETGDANYYVSPVRTSSFMFGDIYSYKANDPYKCMIIGRATENTAASTSENFPFLNAGSATGLATTLSGHYIARGATGVGSALAVGKHTDFFKAFTGGPYPMGFVGNNNFSYPNAADNGLYMAPCFIHHNAGVRGYLKGFWTPVQDNPLGHTDTFSGTGGLAAKTFMVVTLANNNNQSPCGECFLETSNTWS